MSPRAVATSKEYPAPRPEHVGSAGTPIRSETGCGGATALQATQSSFRRPPSGTGCTCRSREAWTRPPSPRKRRGGGARVRPPVCRIRIPHEGEDNRTSMGWEASETSDAQLPAGCFRTAKQQACVRILLRYTYSMPTPTPLAAVHVRCPRTTMCHTFRAAAAPAPSLTRTDPDQTEQLGRSDWDGRSAGFAAGDSDCSRRPT